MSFAKTANILEGSGVFIGNVIDRVEAENLVFNPLKTSLLTGAFTSIQGGRAVAATELEKPLVQTGSDSSGANPSITFTSAFKSGTVPKVFCQIVNNSAASLDSTEVYAVTNTGFTLRKKTFNGTAITATNYTVLWVAFGESQ